MFSGDFVNYRRVSEKTQCWDWRVAMAFGCRSWPSSWGAGPDIRTCSHLRQWLVFDVLLCAPQCICMCSEEKENAEWQPLLFSSALFYLLLFHLYSQAFDKRKAKYGCYEVKSCGEHAQINANNSGVDITHGWRPELLIPVRLKQDPGFGFFSPYRVSMVSAMGMREE